MQSHHLAEIMKEQCSLEVVDRDKAISSLKLEVETLIEEKKVLSRENSDLRNLKASADEALSNFAVPRVILRHQRRRSLI